MLSRKRHRDPLLARITVGESVQRHFGVYADGNSSTDTLSTPVKRHTPAGVKAFVFGFHTLLQKFCNRQPQIPRAVGLPDRHREITAAK